jgi:hypothetical protein
MIIKRDVICDLLPPPLRGRVGVGGNSELLSVRPPPPTPSRKGEGRFAAVPVYRVEAFR